VLTDPRFSVQPKDRFPIGDPAMWRRLRGALEEIELAREAVTHCPSGAIALSGVPDLPHESTRGDSL
jgi:hypothetical protein